MLFILLKIKGLIHFIDVVCLAYKITLFLHTTNIF